MQDISLTLKSLYRDPNFLVLLKTHMSLHGSRYSGVRIGGQEWALALLA